MDKQKVIEFANIAFGDCTNILEIADPYWTTDEDQLQTFAQLMRDDYRAELLAGSGEPVANFGWSHVNDIGVHITTFLGYVAITTDAKIYTTDQLAAAVLRERDAVINHLIQLNIINPEGNLINIIRARGTK